jgi:DNA topoisomerase-1
VKAATELCRTDARRAGLVYSTDSEPGISRRRCGRGWSFHAPSGEVLAGDERQRCLSLAVPPAYEDVWICPHPRGHLQATGRDARGRKTYIYHEDWRTFRSEKKFDDLASFGNKLGRARAQNDEARHGLAPRRARILSAIFWLLDQHALRIGHETYTEENGSYGATTLRHRHLRKEDAALVFPGKSGSRRQVQLTDRRARRMIRKLADLPGQHLFQYEDGDELKPVHSDEVNAYLAGLFGENVTAKTFRTWHGSVAAFAASFGDGRKVDDAVAAASSRLGNTKAIARSSYIHPRLISDLKQGRFADGSIRAGGPSRKGLDTDESAFLRWLEAL